MLHAPQFNASRKGRVYCSLTFKLVLRGGGALEARRQEMLAALGREIENRNRPDGLPDRDSGPETDR